MADQMAHLFPSTSQPLPSSAAYATPQPSSHSISTLDDGVNLHDWKLPPEALKTLARYHASGQLSTVLNHLAQLPPPEELAATTKRTTAVRSHSHLGIPNPNGPSTYARAPMIPKPVPQPLDAARYQPPPMKARTRRAARGRGKADKGKARAAARRDSDGAEHIPPFDLQRRRATRLAPSRAFAAAGIPTHSDESSTEEEPQPSQAWKDLVTVITDPTQQSTPSNGELARVICEQPGLQHLPLRLVEKALPQLRGVAWEKKVDGPSGSSAHQDNPRPLDIEAPRTNMLPIVPPVPVPEMDQPAFSGYVSLTPPESLPPMAPTTAMVDPPLQTVHSPATLNPFWTFEGLVQNETTSIATAAQEINAEEEHREALEPFFDVNFQFNYEGNTGISPTTYEDIESILIPVLDQYQSTGLERETNTNETGTGDLAGLDYGVLDQSWEQFINFSG